MFAMTDEQMNKLEIISDLVNKASDDLNKQIEELEEYLAKLNLGVKAWVSIASGFSFGYDKLRGNWVLCIQENEKSWRFADAPRRLRLEAIKYTPTLMSNILDNSAQLLESLKSQVENKK